LYAFLALGSEAGALKVDSRSFVAFLTTEDAVEPRPSLLADDEVGLVVDCRECLDAPFGSV